MSKLARLLGATMCGLLAALGIGTAATARPRSRRPAPKPGDWEGSAHGHPLSLDVVRRGQRALVRDLVLEVPSGCRNRGDETYGLLAFTSVPSSAAARNFARGGVTGSFGAARLAHASYRRALHGCDSGRFDWTLHPTPRRPVGDGDWAGATATGDPLRFATAYGGRELRRLEGQVSARCHGGQQSASFSYNALFVPPGGSFAHDLARAGHLHVHVAGTFDSPTQASGTFSVDGLCAPVSASWTASLR